MSLKNKLIVTLLCLCASDALYSMGKRQLEAPKTPEVQRTFTPGQEAMQRVERARAVERAEARRLQEEKAGQEARETQQRLAEQTRTLESKIEQEMREQEAKEVSAKIKSNREAAKKIFPQEKPLKDNIKIALDELRALKKSQDTDRFSIILQFLQDIPAKAYEKEKISLEDRLELSKLILTATTKVEYARTVDALTRILTSINLEEFAAAISENATLKKEFYETLSALPSHLKEVSAQESAELSNWAFSLLGEFTKTLAAVKIEDIKNIKDKNFARNFVLRILNLTSSLADLSPEQENVLTATLNIMASKNLQGIPEILDFISNELKKGQNEFIKEKESVKKKRMTASLAKLRAIGLDLLQSFLANGKLLAQADIDQIKDIATVYDDLTRLTPDIKQSRRETIALETIKERLTNEISAVLQKKDYDSFKKLKPVILLFAETITDPTIAQEFLNTSEGKEKDKIKAEIARKLFRTLINRPIDTLLNLSETIDRMFAVWQISENDEGPMAGLKVLSKMFEEELKTSKIIKNNSIVLIEKLFLSKMLEKLMLDAKTVMSLQPNGLYRDFFSFYFGPKASSFVSDAYPLARMLERMIASQDFDKKLADPDYFNRVAPILGEIAERAGHARVDIKEVVQRLLKICEQAEKMLLENQESADALSLFAMESFMKQISRYA